MNFTGERFITTINNERLAIEHWHRYLWASLFTKDKKVLDIACGTGYGSHYLAKNANCVYGFDISPEAITDAKQNYNDVTFDVMGVDNIKLPDNSIDVITSFETIEHVDEQAQNKALGEFQRILTQKGILLISTPSIASPRHIEGNHFHVKELSLEEFKQKLQHYFKNVVIIGQSAINASVIGNCFICEGIFDREFPDFSQDKNINVEENKYLLAICSNNEIINVPGSILIDRKFIKKETCQTVLPKKKKTMAEKILSIKNEYNNNKKHKVLTILGITIKINSKEKSNS